jgi:multisubunit Na+/H+ antiporter MnhG subunit
MLQNNQKGQDNAQPPDHRLHYETLIRLFSLGSQEFYNRFAAMVLSHTILLSGLIIGFGVFQGANLDKCTKMVAVLIALFGIALCAVWGLLLCQSLKAQHFYRDEAKHMEEQLGFRIFSTEKWQELCKGCYSIKCLSTFVIALFVVLYAVLLLFIAIS